MMCCFRKWIQTKTNEKVYGKLGCPMINKTEYVELTSCEEARDWGMKYYEKWGNQYQKTMDDLEFFDKTVAKCFVNPIKLYCGYMYEEINPFLRYGVDKESHIYRELSDILTIILYSAPRIPHNLVLYRMVCDDFANQFEKKYREETECHVLEKGFMSTSLLKEIVHEDSYYAHWNNMLKIYVPEDTVGIYVNAVVERSEEEVLLPPHMTLRLIEYPHYDESIQKKVFECQLI